MREARPGMTDCAHCGLPAPARQDGQPAFCCVGCEVVYQAIRAGGFESFYQLRGLGGDGWTPRGIDRRSQRFGHFDSEEFLEEQTELLADGSRFVRLHLEGVHCAGCVWITEKMPHAVPGVLDAQLSLSRGRLDVRWNPERVSLSETAQWLAQFGYMPHPVRADRIAGASDAERALLKRVGASWAISGNIMILAVAGYGGLSLATEPMLATFMRWVSLALATISMVYGGGVFFRRAFESLRGLTHRSGPSGWTRLSMDVPIALGLFVGWAHSAIATIRGVGDVWFDSIAILIAALLTARWLQMRGRRFAGDAAEGLLSLLPSVARRVEDSGEISEVPAHRLQVGELVEVRAGDVVPADGIVESGRSTLHRAVVTGESRPEAVEVGDLVEAGVTNLGNPLRVRVRAAGNDTRVGQLMQWVEDGERRRAPVVQLADQLGGIFVLVVLVAALATGVVWSFIDSSQAVAHVVALLVISCPCALGMATPLALTVGVGRAAKQGVFIKHDDVLQALSKATHVVFDKTGTLSEGRMTVSRVEGSHDAAYLAARLESSSAHPIAKALGEWGDYESGGLYNQVELSAVEETLGQGIQGRVGDTHVQVGRLRWMQISDVQGAQDKAWLAVESRAVEDGMSPVFVAIDGQLQAAVGIGDRLRHDAKEVLEGFAKKGIQSALLSGDHPRLVEACAAELGIDPELQRGGVSPEQKRDFIQALREKNPTAVIVMVGDGVNDAIALQEADVGVAVHGGTQAALVAADIFMTREGVSALKELMQGTEEVMRTVRRNLLGSAVYNAVGISAAALGLVVPLVAAIAMPFSSLFVIGSSLSQRSFRPRRAAERSMTTAVPRRPRGDGPLSEAPIGGA